MTSLLVGGTLIPITAALAVGIGNDTEVPTLETVATTDETPVSNISMDSTENTTISEESSS